MKTIQKYIFTNFLVTFSMTLLILTFVMSIGVIFKVTDLLASGASWVLIFRMILYGIPPALAFSIPISVLTASLLVFGRLSADGEITAMKACGISMNQIISPCLLVSVFLAVFCGYINNELSPNANYARKMLVFEVAKVSPLHLLDEGRFIQDFENMTIYIQKKKGDQLRNVRIYDLRDKDVKREIQAETGTLSLSTNGHDIIINLYNGHIDPVYQDSPGRGKFGEMEVTIPNALKKRRKPRKRQLSMTMSDLLYGIRHTKDRFPQYEGKDLARARMSLKVELHKRLALSLACFSFVLLGVPLGITAHRKESSAGVGISLFLVFNFYLFIIIAESLSKRPAVQPHLIVWLPVIISIIAGTLLVKRTN